MPRLLSIGVQALNIGIGFRQRRRVMMQKSKIGAMKGTRGGFNAAYIHFEVAIRSTHLS